MLTNSVPNVNEQAYDETKFLDYLQTLRDIKVFGGLHIRLSKLVKDPIQSQSYQVGLRTFEKFTQHINSKLFKFRSGDLFFIFHLTELNEIQKIASKLKDIFSDFSQANPQSASEIYKIYNLEVELDDAIIIAQNMLDNIGLGSYSNKYKEDEARESLTLSKLEKLENALENVNLGTFIRQQPVCVVMNDKFIKTIFREYYISIPDFQKQVMPKTNLSSNFLLFRYLTKILDKRVLSSLEQGDQKFFESAFSLNLNVETVLSSQFMRFDQNIKASVRGTIVIELDIADVFSDIAAFLYARQFLKDHQYRICLTGLTFKSLPFVNREELGVDLLKLIWTTNMGGDESSNLIKAYLKTTAPERIILSRCDTQISVETGQKLGFTLYQGKYVQFLSNKK